MTTALLDKPTISHSQLTSWRSCQQRWDYAYRQKLVKFRLERPLYVGNWIHRCLETMYHPEIQDWRVGHNEYIALYNKLPADERFRLDKGRSKRKSEDPADYEPIPSQVERIVRSYKWYYRKKNERTIATEVEFFLDRGEYLLHGFIDRIYEDLDMGLIVVQDHKSVDDVPEESAFHTVDPQLSIYFAGAEAAAGVQAQAVEFNYLWSSPPSLPKQNKDGSVSKAEVATDYPTFFRWLKEHGFDPREYSDALVPLMGASPFLRRYRLPREQVVVDRILKDADRTAREILGHPHTVRNLTRACNWCPYAALCRAELFGLDTKYMRNHDFMTEKERDEMRTKRGR